MKIGREQWAVVHEDGTIAGDGEFLALGVSKRDGDKYIREMEFPRGTRVVRVKLVEVKKRPTRK